MLLRTENALNFECVLFRLIARPVLPASITSPSTGQPAMQASERGEAARRAACALLCKQLQQTRDCSRRRGIEEATPELRGRPGRRRETIHSFIKTPRPQTSIRCRSKTAGSVGFQDLQCIRPLYRIIEPAQRQIRGLILISCLYQEQFLIVRVCSLMSVPLSTIRRW